MPVDLKLRGKETVLVVEDEEPLRCVVTDLLTQFGYHVLSAASGKEALALVQSSKTIDMLVTDVVMPEMTGPELAAKVLQSRPKVKIIFVSGYTDGHLASHGSLTPEAVLVHKPFSIKVLTAKMRELLDA
ncbi:MAG TPA: response regulator [Candidatus Angelobacter sp.]|nr:response regulator [Candidatus Angelobacter sp.]